MTSEMPYMVMEIHVTPWENEHAHTESDPHSWHSFIDRVEPGYKRDVCEVLVTSRPIFYI